MASLTHKTTTGVLWNLLQQFVPRGITLLVTLVLAYFLTPDDFGLVAMMAVFLAIANSLVKSGSRQVPALINVAKPVDFNAGFQGSKKFNLSRSAINKLSEQISAALRKFA